MKIHFQVSPISRHLRGWKRVSRLLKQILHGTLVIELGGNPAA